MKAIVVASIALAVALGAGCGKKQPAADDPPAPTTPTPVTTPDSPPAPAAAPDADDACVMKLALTGGGLTWTTATGGGGMADGINAASLVEAAKDDRPCSALISADDKTAYQDVITVMDALAEGGIRDIALDVGGPAHGGPKAASDADLRQAPVVVVTTEAVKLSGTDIARLEDPQLENLLGKALASEQQKKPGSRLVLQADQATPWKTLSRVVRAARGAGFADLLFAVKNK